VSVTLIRPGQITAVGSGGLRVLRPGGASLDPDAAANIARMDVTPDSTRQTAINQVYLDLKAASIYSQMDEFWFYAAHDQQAGLLGWKGYKDATAVNAPTFTVDRGFAGNGTTSYLNSNFVPSTHGVQYTLNDASYGVYSRTSGQENKEQIGANGASGSSVAGFARMRVRNTNNIGQFWINATDSVNPLNRSNTFDGSGLFSLDRTASDAISLWRNGAELTTYALQPSQDLSTVAFYIGAANNNGSLAGPSTRQLAFAFFAGAMSAQKYADLYTIVTDYLTVLGAAV
jgi:hypothetical protein